MAEIASAYVSLIPSAKGFGKQTDSQIGPQLDTSGKTGGRRFGGGFAKGAKSLIGPAIALAASGAAVKFFKDSIAEAREAQKVGAQTAAVIKSTGGAANLTAKQFGTLATSISNKVGIDDEEIQAGENMLATFTNVRNELGKGNDVFSQATKLAVDLGVATKTGPTQASLLLGKALNDPAKGLSRLTRIGITFTDQQKAQVLALTKSGDRLGAQKIILREVAREFGGSAAAQATAGDKFRVSIKNLEEAAGNGLIPVLDKLAVAGTKGIAWAQKNPGAFKLIAIGLTAMGVAAKIAAIDFAALDVSALLIPIAIGAIVAGLVYAYTHFTGFRNGVIQTANAIGGAFTSLYNNILRPILKYLVTDIGVTLIAFGALVKGLSHVPGFGWAHDAGVALENAGHKALDLAGNIKKIPPGKLHIDTTQLDKAEKISRTTNQSLRIMLGLPPIDPAVNLKPLLDGKHHADAFQTSLNGFKGTPPIKPKVDTTRTDAAKLSSLLAKQAIEKLYNTSNKGTTVKINAASVKLAKSYTQDLLNVLKKVFSYGDKTIHVKTVYTTVGSKTGTTAATGGYIRGPGSGTSDSIPAMLSNGEYVINAAATKKNLALLHRINSQRYANGGPVGSVSGADSSLRVVSGNFTIDKNGRAWFEGVADDRIDASLGFAQVVGGMNR